MIVSWSLSIHPLEYSIAFADVVVHRRPQVVLSEEGSKYYVLPSFPQQATQTAGTRLIFA